MILFHVLLLISALVVHGKSVVKEDESKELKWPDTYTLKLIKVYLTAGMTEDLQIWKTKTKSRVDYNNGAVKSIVDRDGKKYGIQYKIHPVADEEGKSKESCTVLKGTLTNKVLLDDILPDTDGFTEYGTEFLNNVATTKFYYEAESDNSPNIVNKQTIWAVYDSEMKVWTPVRYEVKDVNNWFGSLEKHDIWDFLSFKTEVLNEDFGIDKSCNNPEEVSLNNDETMRHTDPEKDKHVDIAFKAFVHKYNKKYENSAEHNMRKSIFRRSMRLVEITNRQNRGYTLTINKFADRTPQEMLKHTGLRSRPVGKKGNIQFPYSDQQLKEIAVTFPSEYDTRLYGLVGPVKNQQSCGSCWTFGTTASMEGAVAKHYGKFVTLSNQAILDCAWPYGGTGCDGGSDTAAYGWIKDNGIPTQAEYGDYLNQEGICHIHNMTTLYKIQGFVDVTPNSIDALKAALIENGPLTVSVNANEALIKYAGGIFYDSSCDPTVLNHEVTLVGYGEENGETYWILRNSWGPEWGIDGYMHISAKDNVCGVASEPTYAVVE